MCKNKEKIICFMRFLKDNFAYDAYIKNFNDINGIEFRFCTTDCESSDKCIYKNVWYWLMSAYPYDYILSAFHWVASKEGNQFWDKIHLQWVKFLDSHKETRDALK